jgi:uncharacterized membrane protein
MSANGIRFLTGLPAGLGFSLLLFPYWKAIFVAKDLSLSNT